MKAIELILIHHFGKALSKLYKKHFTICLSDSPKILFGNVYHSLYFKIHDAENRSHYSV